MLSECLRLIDYVIQEDFLCYRLHQDTLNVVSFTLPLLDLFLAEKVIRMRMACFSDEIHACT